MSFRNDYKIGMDNEAKVLEMIKTRFKDARKINDKMYPFDFYIKSKNAYLELKSRRCRSSDYTETLISEYKLSESYRMMRAGCTVFLLFYFEGDGKLLYHNVDRNYKYQIRDFVRHGRIDFMDTRKKYVYLPVKDLKEFILST